MATIHGFEHPPRCGGTSHIFEVLGVIFGFENMMIWGSDFPYKFADVRRIFESEQRLITGETPRALAGHFADPTWQPPLIWDSGHSISWTTQIRHPRLQLASARTYVGGDAPTRSRRLLAATLERVVSGFYSAVGILDENDRSSSLAWQLHEKWGFPYVLSTKRNASVDAVRRHGSSQDGPKRDYVPFEFKGLEILEWWNLAVERVEASKLSASRAPVNEMGALPIFLLPPRQDPLFSVTWNETTITGQSERVFEARIGREMLGNVLPRFVAMAQAKASDGFGEVQVVTQPTQILNRGRLGFRRLRTGKPAAPSRWTRQDLFTAGHRMGIAASEAGAWAGAAFSGRGNSDVVIRVSAPLSTELELLSDLRLYSAI